ncbi:MAG TPA: hypothetical protein VG407_18625 [Caulobacteraceae bacterium]|jgi:hypothetical protein|nr:hypothetical protein [Caulobacteraceae bacterium]
MLVVSRNSPARSERKRPQPLRSAPAPEWREFIAAVAYLSPPHRILVAQICRQLEVVQAAHGEEVAEAAIERIIRAIESEDGFYLS